MKQAILVLADNTVYRSKGVGKCGVYSGELVFTTAMTGYVEALTLNLTPPVLNDT